MLNAKILCCLFFVLILILTGCGSSGSSTTYTTSSTASYGTLRSISVQPVNPLIAANTHRQFTATGIFTNNRTADITDLVTWRSSNTNVATVSNAWDTKGFAAALNLPGTTTISASSGGKIGSTRLTVTTATISSIVVTPVNPSIPNETSRRFTATGSFSDGTTQDITESATWTSDTQSVATIGNTAGSKGFARAVGVGSSTITALFGGRTDSTALTVTPPALISILVAPASLTIFIGTTQQFTATGYFDNNTTQDITSSVTWLSSDTGVASINSLGLVAALSGGTTTITATSGAVSKTATLTVVRSGTLSLTWNAPIQYADLSPLNPAVDLRSYHVYYRTASQAYIPEQMMTFTNPGTAIVTQSVTLATGTYFFAVTAVTQDYWESGYSNEISETIY